MPSKKSETWKSQLACSESDLQKIAQELAIELKSGDRVFLEGTLGTGKSTFARWMLQSLGLKQSLEGSPTFPIAHEYKTSMGEVIHIDFYRLRSEDEIFDAGIEEYFWGRNATVFCEWISQWPQFEKKVLKSSGESARVWKVELGLVDETHRNIRIS